MKHTKLIILITSFLLFIPSSAFAKTDNNDLNFFSFSNIFDSIDSQINSIINQITNSINQNELNTNDLKSFSFNTTNINGSTSNNLNISANGFTPNENVSILFDTKKVDDEKADKNGNVSFSKNFNQDFSNISTITLIGNSSKKALTWNVSNS